ncbi:hypothetical protein HK414_03280 [Ramlibacter terrae]|uniref:Uncharacterized protein n=1 Tax=Ramlibacter terrae TaxID=2732511 RepID=A0ABX6P0F5_9BURK|nr:hypothetical protein HK414_03280 [Ramlibacter terrae]
MLGKIWVDRANLNKYDDANCSTHGPCSDWKNKVKGALPGAPPSWPAHPRPAR